MGIFTDQDNRSLDRIISVRRSVRKFKDELPPKNLIEQVVEAGVKAPYAGISALDVEVFRHIFVLNRESSLLPEVDRLIKEQSRIDLTGLDSEIASDPFIRNHSDLLHKIWSSVAEKGIPGFLDAPYLIVAAEWAGARQAQRQSLSHLMQNMWLKATALELGFMLVSPVESMTSNREFCRLFDLPEDRYGFHACVLGYPEKPLDQYKPPSAGTRVQWL